MINLKTLPTALLAILIAACGNEVEDEPDFPEHSDELINETETDQANIRLYEVEGTAAGEAIGDERLQQIGTAQKIIEGVAGQFSIRFEDQISLPEGTYRLEVQTFNAMPVDDVTDDVMEFLVDEFNLSMERTTASVTRYLLEIEDAERLEEFRNHESPPEINRTQRENGTISLGNASLDHIARILQSEFEYEIHVADDPGYRIDHQLQLPDQWDEMETKLSELGLRTAQEETERDIFVIANH